MGFLSSSRSPSRSAFSLEPLESRILLTTLDGDGILGPSIFEFHDVRDQVIRIHVGPGTVAEFIGAKVSANNQITLGDLIPPVRQEGSLVTGQNVGADLFHIYVVQSNPDSWISIARVDDNASNRPITPFEGNLDLRINPNRITESAVVTVGPGEALLGALSIEVENVNNQEGRPFVSGFLPGAWGVRPAGLDDFPWDPTVNVAPGLRVAPGVVLGRFLIGGVVTGAVVIPESMELFYAGGLFTGSSAGQLQGSVINPHNFRVGGDLRNLLVGGNIGASDGSTNPVYITGFDLFVGGRLGQIATGGSLTGSIYVDASMDAPVFPRPIREAEGAGEGRTFAGGYPGNELWDNHIFENPQYVNSLSAGFEQERIHIQGTLLSPTLPGIRPDPVDYFAVPLLAGQQVTVQLSNFTGARVGVFDPDGRLIASDYSKLPGAQGLPFTFITDRPGAYRFAVSGSFDFDFVGGFGAHEYDLFIDGAGGIAVGGIVVGGQFFDHVFDRHGIYVQAGDFGGLFRGSASGPAIIGEVIFDPASIAVQQGNFRAYDGAGGFLELDVPTGNVGLLRAGGGLTVNQWLDLASPSIGAIAGDYQLIEAGTFYGKIFANGNIGVIRAGSIDGPHPIFGLPAYVVNANNSGRSGRIDLIDVVGNMGTIAALKAADDD